MLFNCGDYQTLDKINEKLLAVAVAVAIAGAGAIAAGYIVHVIARRQARRLHVDLEYLALPRRATVIKYASVAAVVDARGARHLIS